MTVYLHQRLFDGQKTLLEDDMAKPCDTRYGFHHSRDI